MGDQSRFPRFVKDNYLLALLGVTGYIKGRRVYMATVALALIIFFCVFIGHAE